MVCENYYAVVVIYNQKCSESITCRNLKSISEKNKSIRIIIADNSTQEKIKRTNYLQCKNYQWQYKDMGGNKGLSVAYNSVIEELPRLSLLDCVIWFDDDTDITETYFENLKHSMESNPKAEIFVPIIRGLNGKIYSPNERGFFRNHFISNIQEKIDPKRFNAINSCMAVKTELYRSYRYDETLFMDMVDQKFCLDVSKTNKQFAIVDEEVVQNFFQRSQNLSVEKVWSRYQVRIRDFMNYANTDALHRWIGIIKVGFWGFDMAVRCRSIRILFMCLAKGIQCAVELSLKHKGH